MSATELTTGTCAEPAGRASARALRLPSSRTAAGQATRDVAVAFVASRLLVFAASLFGAWALPQGPFALNRGIAGFFFRGWPASGALVHVFSPLIRGDALTYVMMPTHGYHVPGMTSGAVYFPGYPFLVAILGGVASPGASAIVGSVVSLAAFLGALWLLHRLVALDFGASVARTTVLLLAFCPWAYFFSAPYTESLFLLLTVGAVYAARTEHWAVAGLVAAAASGTRNSGVLLIVPLALLYLFGPARAERSHVISGRRLMETLRARVRPNALWLTLVPAGLIAYSAYLLASTGHPLLWSQQQAAWGRATSAPWNGVYLGARAAVHALDGAPFDAVFRAPALLDMGVLVLVAGCLVIAWRRMPMAYAAYATIASIVTVSAVSHTLTDEPLISFPRYALVLFPVFIALALVCERRRLTLLVVPVAAAGLAVLSALFAAGYPYF